MGEPVVLAGDGAEAHVAPAAVAAVGVAVVGAAVLGAGGPGAAADGDEVGLVVRPGDGREFRDTP
jgi:hypothetical protein